MDLHEQAQRKGRLADTVQYIMRKYHIGTEHTITRVTRLADHIPSCRLCRTGYLHLCFVGINSKRVERELS